MCVHIYVLFFGAYITHRICHERVPLSAPPVIIITRIRSPLGFPSIRSTDTNFPFFFLQVIARRDLLLSLRQLCTKRHCPPVGHLWWRNPGPPTRPGAPSYSRGKTPCAQNFTNHLKTDRRRSNVKLLNVSIPLSNPFGPTTVSDYGDTPNDTSDSIRFRPFSNITLSKLTKKPTPPPSTIPTYKLKL